MRPWLDPEVTARPTRAGPSPRPPEEDGELVGWTVQGNAPRRADDAPLPKDYQCRRCLTLLDETELDDHVCPDIIEMRNE